MAEEPESNEPITGEEPFPQDQNIRSQLQLFDERPPSVIDQAFSRWQELLAERERIEGQLRELIRFLGFADQQSAILKYCLQCGHRWQPRNPRARRPQMCPRCTSHNWDKEVFHPRTTNKSRVRKKGSGRPKGSVKKMPGEIDPLVEVTRRFELPPPPQLRDCLLERKVRFGES
jgi:predicted Zn-ribbon and HTH transcriptional regulator